MKENYTDLCASLLRRYFSFASSGEFVRLILYFMRPANNEREKPFVIKDLLERLDEQSRKLESPGPITSSQGFLFFFLPLLD